MLALLPSAFAVLGCSNFAFSFLLVGPAVVAAAAGCTYVHSWCIRMRACVRFFGWEMGNRGRRQMLPLLAIALIGSVGEKDWKKRCGFWYPERAITQRLCFARILLCACMYRHLFGSLFCPLSFVSAHSAVMALYVPRLKGRGRI